MKNFFISIIIFGTIVIYSSLSIAGVEKTESEPWYDYNICYMMSEFHTNYVKTFEFNEMVPRRDLNYYRDLPPDSIDACTKGWDFINISTKSTGLYADGALTIPFVRVELYFQRLGSPCLFSSNDIYDMETSENIKLVRTKHGTRIWRGAVYETLDFYLFHCDETLKKGNAYRYWISYKMKRLPHTHLSPTVTNFKDKRINLSVGVEPYLGDLKKLIKIKKWIRVIAIPRNSIIHSIESYQPKEIKKTDDWIFLIYDRTGLTQHVSLHPSFTILADAPALDCEKVALELLGEKE